MFVFSLPDDKFFKLVQFTSKVHVDDKINVTQNLNFVLGRVESILEKEQNAVFKRPLPLEVRTVW